VRVLRPKELVISMGDGEGRTYLGVSAIRSKKRAAWGTASKEEGVE